MCTINKYNINESSLMMTLRNRQWSQCNRVHSCNHDTFCVIQWKQWLCLMKFSSWISLELYVALCMEDYRHIGADSKMVQETIASVPYQVTGPHGWRKDIRYSYFVSTIYSFEHSIRYSTLTFAYSYSFMRLYFFRSCKEVFLMPGPVHVMSATLRYIALPWLQVCQWWSCL